MINLQHKYIFIHIPKCAGSSIEIALTGEKYNRWDELNKIFIQHATAKQIKELYCKNYENYFSFAIVRNPWDRALSDYFWMMRELRFHDTFVNYLTLKGRFSTRRLRYPHINKRGRGDHIIAQSDYILNDAGDSMVNYVGRFENLQADFDIIYDKIGVPRKQLPRVNKTRHMHYTKHYNAETRKIVAEKYAKDIEYFGYEFGE